MKIGLNDPQYPEQLRRLAKPPDALYYQGSESLLEQRYISIVGAREAEPWVEEWMEQELLPVLQEFSLGVISGGARGVDQMAHRLCVRAQRPTLVVLPSGCGVKYPSNLHQYEGNRHVGFLSEYTDEVTMRKYYFYKRNRIIAALSGLILIIQASEKSGTMITAKYAIDLNCVIAALPGHPLNSNFSGNNQLLFDGAQMVRNQRDLKALLLGQFCQQG